MLIGARTAEWSGGGEEPFHGYVSDGLMHYWDAIDNVGLGDAGHDDSSTVWKDLAGDHEMTLLTNYNAKFRSNSIDNFDNSFNSAICRSTYPSTINGVNTAEIIFKFIRQNEGTIVFVNGARDSGTFPFFANYGGVSCQDGIHEKFPSSINNGEFHLYSAVHNADGTNTLYLDGVEVVNPTVATDGGWTNPDNSFTIGSSNNQNYMYYSSLISVCVIRFYSSRLTGIDISKNYAIDKIRFGLA